MPEQRNMKRTSHDHEPDTMSMTESQKSVRLNSHTDRRPAPTRMYSDGQAVEQNCIVSQKNEECISRNFQHGNFSACSSSAQNTRLNQCGVPLKLAEGIELDDVEVDTTWTNEVQQTDVTSSLHGGSSNEGDNLLIRNIDGPLGGSEESAGDVSSNNQNNQHNSSRRNFWSLSTEEMCQLGDRIVGSPYYNPTWTVSHLKTILSMEHLMKLFTCDINDEVTRQFLEVMLCKEESGLPEDTFVRRLWTKNYMTSTTPLDSDNSAGSDENREICSICMVDYKDHDKIAVLYYCQHEYHVDCIKKWLLNKNVCPICRALAFIPEGYPDWYGDDIRFHQFFFQYVLNPNRG